MTLPSRKLQGGHRQPVQSPSTTRSPSGSWTSAAGWVSAPWGKPDATACRKIMQPAHVPSALFTAAGPLGRPSPLLWACHFRGAASLQGHLCAASVLAAPAAHSVLPHGGCAANAVQQCLHPCRGSVQLALDCQTGTWLAFAFRAISTLPLSSEVSVLCRPATNDMQPPLRCNRRPALAPLFTASCRKGRGSPSTH